MEYYEILGLSPGATKEEIKKAYHAMAHIHHPDKDGDVKKFHKVVDAYNTLMRLVGTQPNTPRGFYTIVNSNDGFVIYY